MSEAPRAMLSVVLVVAIVGGCQSIARAPTERPNLTPTPQPRIALLRPAADIRTEYVATAWTQTGAAVALVPGTEVVIWLDGRGRFGARTDCGSVGGDYQLDGDRFVLTGVGRGRTLADEICGAERERQDVRLAAFLLTPLAYAPTDTGLVLSDGGTEIVFAEQPARLGPTWRATRLTRGTKDLPLPPNGGVELEPWSDNSIVWRVDACADGRLTGEQPDATTVLLAGDDPDLSRCQTSQADTRAALSLLLSSDRLRLDGVDEATLSAGDIELTLTRAD